MRTSSDRTEVAMSSARSSAPTLRSLSVAYAGLLTSSRNALGDGYATVTLASHHGRSRAPMMKDGAVPADRMRAPTRCRCGALCRPYSR
jgi:hypothetical protein